MDNTLDPSNQPSPRDGSRKDSFPINIRFREKLWARCKLWHNPTIAERYFGLVANELECLTEPSDPEQKKLWQQAKSEKDRMTQRINHRLKLRLSEVFCLESMVLRILPKDRLLSKAWSIREAYQRVVSENTFKRYEASNPPLLNRNADDNSLAKIRADAEDLLTGIHWLYTSSNYREKRIQRIKTSLVWWLCLTALAFLFLAKCNKAEPSALLMLGIVMLVGTMGAVLSIGRRMLPISSQDVAQSDPVIRATQFDHGWIGIVLSILAGGISALVLYLLMAAGLSDLGGELMPKFVSAYTDNKECAQSLNLNTYFSLLMPVNTVSFAKVLCWSFVAGFAEKFVPDILDRMAKNDKTSAK